LSKRLFRVLLFFSIVFIFPSKNALAVTDSNDEQEWIVIGEGIEYRKFQFTFTDPDPDEDPRLTEVFVTRMDRSNLDVTIDTGIAQGRLSGGIETVLGMANRYDQAINYWGKTWGNRNQVVVAINGYYFNNQQNPIGVPWSGQIHSGWYAKRFDDYNGDAGFGWTLNRNAFIGDCVHHKSSKQKVSFENSSYQPNLRATNVLRNDEELILYTPQFDSTTGTSSTSGEPILEILIEMTRPTLILPIPAKATGHIREIRDRGGSTQLPFDHIVLTAWGAIRDTLLGRIDGGEIAVGDSVGISQEISICPDSPFDDWTNAYAGLGGDYHFLNDGVIRTNFSNPDAWVPNSRTAVAYNQSYIYFIVVDRWNPGVSEGITIPELADFAKNTLEATDAVTQDSGGSSTMAINGEVVNNTDCNFTDCRPPLPPISANPGIVEISPELVWNPFENLYGTPSGPTAINVAPLVANTMMMVVVQEKKASDSFEPGGYAIPMRSTAIRLGPGSNYASIGTLQENAIGVFQDHSNKLNGVLATGDYWWKASFDGLTGWVKESDLYGGSPVLEADFKAAPKEGPVPLTVDFTNRSIGDYSEIHWDFGDGVTSTITNPVHTYISGGIYNPTLTISGPGGDAQHQDEIRVTETVYQVFLPLIQYLETWFRVYIPVILR
jgi:PKD repeat protein